MSTNNTQPLKARLKEFLTNWKRWATPDALRFVSCGLGIFFLSALSINMLFTFTDSAFSSLEWGAPRGAGTLFLIAMSIFVSTLCTRRAPLAAMSIATIALLMIPVMIASGVPDKHGGTTWGTMVWEEFTTRLPLWGAATLGLAILGAGLILMAHKLRHRGWLSATLQVLSDWLFVALPALVAFKLVGPAVSHVAMLHRVMSTPEWAQIIALLLPLAVWLMAFGVRASLSVDASEPSHPAR